MEKRGSRYLRYALFNATKMCIRDSPCIVPIVLIQGGTSQFPVHCMECCILIHSVAHICLLYTSKLVSVRRSACKPLLPGISPGVSASLVRSISEMCIRDSADTSLNYLVGMIYSNLFQTLYYVA